MGGGGDFLSLANLRLIEFDDRAGIPLLREAALGSVVERLRRLVCPNIRLVILLGFLTQIFTFDLRLLDFESKNLRLIHIQLLSALIAYSRRLLRLVDCQVDMIGALGSPIRLTKEHFLVIFDFVVARGRYISTNGFFHKFSGYQRSLARPESALAAMTLLEVIVQVILPV